MSRLCYVHEPASSSGRIRGTNSKISKPERASNSTLTNAYKCSMEFRLRCLMTPSKGYPRNSLMRCQKQCVLPSSVFIRSSELMVALHVDLAASSLRNRIVSSPSRPFRRSRWPHMRHHCQMVSVSADFVDLFSRPRLMPRDPVLEIDLQLWDNVD